MNDFDPNYIPKKSFALIGQKAIVLNKNNQFIILQRTDKTGEGSKWSLPGGALEKGEDPYQGIKREISEEIALEVSDLKPFFVKSLVNKDNDFVVVIGYTGKVKDGQIKLNWEHDNFKWVNKDEALQMDLTKDARDIIVKFNLN